MKPKKTIQVAFIIDGFTLKKVNDYYQFNHPFHSSLDFKFLKAWVRREISEKLHKSPDDINLMGHYYHPYRDPELTGKKHYGTKSLERELHYAGYEVHYARQMTELGAIPNTDLIDDMLELAGFGYLDMVVFLTTQGQYRNFPEQLNYFKVPTLLLGWNFTYFNKNRWVRWHTDDNLRENCSQYIAMEEVATAHSPLNSSFTIFRKKLKKANITTFYHSKALSA